MLSGELLTGGIFVLCIAFAGAFMIALIQLRQVNRFADEYRLLIDNLTEGVYRSSIDGTQLSANRALVRMNGYASEFEMLAAVRSIDNEWYVEPGRRAEFQRILHRDGSVTGFVSEVYRHKSRERIWVSENARLVCDVNTGKPVYYEGSVRDITESVRKRQAEERLNKLAEMAPGGLFQLQLASNGTFHVPYVSNPFRTLVGAHPDQDLSNPVSYMMCIHKEDAPHYLETMMTSARTLETWRVIFRFMSSPDAAPRWLEVNARPEKLADGTIQWNGCLADVTEHRELMARVERLAYFDVLTDLPNRRLLVDRLTESMKVCRRRRRSGGLLFLDLDGFKAINDTYGHQTGDNYIRAIGERLIECVRESDTVSRFGGDEFVILLHDLDEDPQAAAENASVVANKVMNGLRRGVEIDGVTHAIYCSIGVNVFSNRERDAETVIRQADHAMYQAKAEGRNTFVVFDDTTTKAPSDRRRVA